jgi:hypothetical protein
MDESKGILERRFRTFALPREYIYTPYIPGSSLVD